MTHIFYIIVLILKHPLVLLMMAAILAGITVWKMPKPVPNNKRFFIYSIFIVLGMNTVIAYAYAYLTWFIGMATFNAPSMAPVSVSMMGMPGAVIQLMLFFIIAWFTLKGFAKTWMQLYDH